MVAEVRLAVAKEARKAGKSGITKRRTGADRRKRSGEKKIRESLSAREGVRGQRTRQ